jgi:lipopolysaccharide export system protein LptA
VAWARTPIAIATSLIVIPALVGAQQGARIWHPAAGTSSVSIKADTVAVNDVDRTATYAGHVAIVADEARLTCSRATVWFRGTTAKTDSIDHVACEP